MNKVAIAAVVGFVMSVGGRAAAAWDSNPSFEAPYTDGWYSFSAATTANSGDFVLDGSLALKIDTGLVGRYTVIDYPHSPPVPGATYTFSVSYYLPAMLVPAENLGIGIWWLKLNGAGTAFEYSSIDPGGTNGGLGPVGSETVGAWKRITYSDVAPADAEYMEIQLEVTGAGSVVYFDLVDITVTVPLVLEQRGTNLVVDFPGGGVLQRATHLFPEDWMDVESGTLTSGPYLVPLGPPESYFRLRAP